MSEAQTGPYKVERCPEFDDFDVFGPGGEYVDCYPTHKEAFEVVAELNLAYAAGQKAANAEVSRLRKLCEVIDIDLSALVADPDNPDFMPALGNNNDADAKCLMHALMSARDGHAGPATPTP